MNEREYRRLKVEAEIEYRRKLEAIEMVWKLSGGANKNGAQPEALGKGRLLQAVRVALGDMHGDFSIHDVERQIRTNNPTLAATIKRPSLSSALKRLAKEGAILAVSVGSGKRPSKYRIGAMPA